MPEHPPGHEEIKDTFDSLQREGPKLLKEEEGRINFTRETLNEQQAELRRQEEEIQKKIAAIKKKLGSLTGEAKQLSEMENNFDELEKTREMWERVGTMRDYGAAIESGEEGAIKEAEKRIQELIDIELKRPGTVVHLLSPKDYYFSPMLGRGAATYQDERIPTELTEKEKDFIFRRTFGMLRALAEGKLLFANKRYSREGVVLSQYSPGDSMSYRSLPYREQFRDSDGNLHNSKMFEPDKRIWEERSFGEFVQGSAKGSVHLIEAENGKPLSEDTAYSRDHLIEDIDKTWARRLYDRLGIEYYTDSKDLSAEHRKGEEERSKKER